MFFSDKNLVLNEMFFTAFPKMLVLYKLSKGKGLKKEQENEKLS